MRENAGSRSGSRPVPEISRFFGIVIQMFANYHAPPHFHANTGYANILIRRCRSWPASCRLESSPLSSSGPADTGGAAGQLGAAAGKGAPESGSRRWSECMNGSARAITSRTQAHRCRVPCLRAPAYFADGTWEWWTALAVGPPRAEPGVFATLRDPAEFAKVCVLPESRTILGPPMWTSVRDVLYPLGRRHRPAGSSRSPTSHPSASTSQLRASAAWGRHDTQSGTPWTSR